MRTCGRRVHELKVELIERREALERVVAVEQHDAAHGVPSSFLYTYGENVRGAAWRPVSASVASHAARAAASAQLVVEEKHALVRTAECGDGISIVLSVQALGQERGDRVHRHEQLWRGAAATELGHMARLELVDVADRLPLLKRRAGISLWKVMGSSNAEYTSYEHFLEANEKQRGKNKITPTMFPPTTEEVAAFNLDRCTRCVPQDENTSGFFICLFKKTAPTHEEQEPEKRAGKKHRALKEPTEGEASLIEDVKAEVEEVTEVKAEVEDGTEVKAEAVEAEEFKDEATVAAVVSKEARPPRMNRQQQQKGEAYVALDPTQWATIQEHFGITAPFSGVQLFMRSDESKSVSFVTKSITNELIEEMKAKKFKVVYTGLKLFERTESSGGGVVYRLCQAGLPHVLPCITKRKITVSKNDFQMLLERLGDLINFDEFDTTTKKIFEDAPIGSISCSLENPQSLIEENIMNIVVWRGRNSVNAMATKADAVVILSAMKELKLFDAQVSEAVLVASWRLRKQVAVDNKRSSIHDTRHCLSRACD